MHVVISNCLLLTFRYQDKFSNRHLDLVTDHDTTLKANIKQDYEIDADNTQTVSSQL